MLASASGLAYYTSAMCMVSSSSHSRLSDRGLRGSRPSMASRWPKARSWASGDESTYGRGKMSSCVHSLNRASLQLMTMARSPAPRRQGLRRLRSSRSTILTVVQATRRKARCLHCWRSSSSMLETVDSRRPRRASKKCRPCSADPMKCTCCHEISRLPR